MTTDSSRIAPTDLLHEMRESDLMARLLLKWKINYWKAGLFMSVYGLFYVFAMPALTGLFSRAIKDWPTMIIVIIFLPLVCSFYVRQMDDIQILFRALTHRIADAEKQKVSIPFVKMFRHKAWFWLAILVAFVQSVYIVFATFQNQTDWQSNIWILLALIPLRFVAFYAVTHIAARQVITILAVNRLLNHYPEDAALFSDREASLFVLGCYILSVGFILGVIGLFLGLTLLRINLGLENWSVEFGLDVVSYFIAAPFLFLLPLWKAHILMSTARQKLLDEVNAKSLGQYVASLGNMRTGKMSEEDVDRLELLDRFANKIKKLPTWPINLTVVSRFSAAVLLPIITPVGIDIATNFFQNVVGKVLGK